MELQTTGYNNCYWATLDSLNIQNAWNPFVVDLIWWALTKFNANSKKNSGVKLDVRVFCFLKQLIFIVCAFPLHKYMIRSSGFTMEFYSRQLPKVLSLKYIFNRPMWNTKTGSIHWKRPYIFVFNKISYERQFICSTHVLNVNISKKRSRERTNKKKHVPKFTFIAKHFYCLLDDIRAVFGTPRQSVAFTLSLSLFNNKLHCQ